MSATVIVVGAGISGVACAAVLTTAGHRVVVRDRARRAGGRMASRRLDGRHVDLGAAYFTARETAFRDVVDEWMATGLALPWTNEFEVHDEKGWSRTGPGPLRYRAPRGLRSLVEDLAEGLELRLSDPVLRVGEGPTVDAEPVDAVVLAMPDPQAARLLDPALTAERAALDAARWSPVIAVVVGWRRRCWRPFDGVFVGNDPVLTFVADDGRRRGDDAPVLVAHTTAELAAAALEDPSSALPDVADATTGLVEADRPPAWTYVHRWSFAQPTAPRTENFHLGEAMVGLCGDSWGSPRVETAWRSGTELGAALVERLG